MSDDLDSTFNGFDPEDDDELVQRLSEYDEGLRVGAVPGPEQPSIDHGAPGLDASAVATRVVCRERLGGLLKHYEHRAA